MKLITYKEQGDQTEQVGILHPDGQRIAPAPSKEGVPSSMNEWITAMDTDSWEQLRQIAEKEESYTRGRQEITVCAPMPHPQQDIICLGVNYREHALEAARFQKEAFDLQDSYPVYFSKRVNEAVGDGQGVPAYEGLTDSLDYEAELAVVLGKDARDVKAEDAEDYIFGYTILNDMSARDLQTRHTQWYFGKSLDGFTVMGPAIVTKDEISYPPRLEIKSLVNGELRQCSNTDMLIFDIGYVIRELSQGMTLKAGTIISTGTPQGVGMGFVPPRFLKKGDTVECRIEKIGTLTNQICGTEGGGR